MKVLVQTSVERFIKYMDTPKVLLPMYFTEITTDTRSTLTQYLPLSYLLDVSS